MRTLETTTADRIADALRAVVGPASAARFHESVAARAGVEIDRSGSWLLVRLANEGPMRLSDLAALQGVDVSTTSRQVKPLLERGLVERADHPTDGRSALLAITEAGLSVHRRLSRERRAVIAAAVESWSPADRDRFAALLERFAVDFAERA
jgi:DNA-binding MarR family transcriptional regulator